MKQIIDALEELAQCDFNEANCASLTVASARVRSIARAALAAAREQQQPIGVVVWSDLAGPTVQWLRAPTVGASLYAAPPAQDAEDAARLAEIREIYAGMDGFVPQTAAEGYCLEIIRKMAHAAMGGAEHG